MMLRSAFWVGYFATILVGALWLIMALLPAHA